MHWNLRIIKKVYPLEDWYEICEVFYDKDNKPMMYTDAVDMAGESLEDLIEYQGMLCEAWDAPVLNERDFPELTCGTLPD